MLQVATGSYQKPFGFGQKDNIRLDPAFWSDQENLTSAEVEALEKPFSEEEIKNAIMESYSCGAPGPDGLSFLFYQTFWHVIKHDFMALVRDFERDVLDTSKLNYAIVTLIPKESDAKTMKQFRPISLGNVSIKIFSKAI